MMQELISAANVAGLFNDRVFGQRADDEWTMLVVLAVERTGDENSIMAWCGKLTRLRVNKCCRSRADASKNLRKGEVSRNFFIATRFLMMEANSRGGPAMAPRIRWCFALSSVATSESNSWELECVFSIALRLATRKEPRQRPGPARSV